MTKNERVFRSFLLENGFKKVSGGWKVPPELMKNEAVEREARQYSDSEAGIHGDFVCDFFIDFFIERIAVEHRVNLVGVALVPCLVLEGDWGGQTYLTVPAKFVGEKANPGQLLKEMNNFAWDCNCSDKIVEETGGDGSMMFIEELMEFEGMKPLELWVDEEFHATRRFRQGEHWHSISVDELAPRDFSPETDMPPQVEFTCEEVWGMKWGERVRQYLDLKNPMKMSLCCLFNFIMHISQGIF